MDQKNKSNMEILSENDKVTTNAIDEARQTICNKVDNEELAPYVAGFFLRKLDKLIEIYNDRHDDIETATFDEMLLDHYRYVEENVAIRASKDGINSYLGRSGFFVALNNYIGFYAIEYGHKLYTIDALAGSKSLEMIIRMQTPDRLQDLEAVVGHKSFRYLREYLTDSEIDLAQIREELEGTDISTTTSNSDEISNEGPSVG